MSEPVGEEVVPLVASIFSVKGVVRNLDALQFEVGDEKYKEKFVQLVQKLEPLNLVARLEKFQERHFILVGRFKPPTIKRVLLQRALFVATVVMVVIDGYFKTLGANKIAYIGDPFTIAALYTLSLMGILGIHELGHIIASKWHKLKTSWPYFIPGIPVIGIPTFGALIMARSFMTNRDTLFDVGISGPIAGLIVAVLVATYGAYTSPMIPVEQANSLFSKSEIVSVQPSLLMSATFAMAGKNVQGMQVIMSPVLYAAWLGFLLTFLNLLPSWQLDGGHIARATLGRKWHRITTYMGIGVLFALGYWFMALYILSFMARSPDVRPLDDISPLSSKRKNLFILVMGLAVICAPIPFWRMH